MSVLCQDGHVLGPYTRTPLPVKLIDADLGYWPDVAAITDEGSDWRTQVFKFVDFLVVVVFGEFGDGDGRAG